MGASQNRDRQRKSIEVDEEPVVIIAENEGTAATATIESQEQPTSPSSVDVTRAPDDHLTEHCISTESVTPETVSDHEAPESDLFSQWIEEDRAESSALASEERTEQKVDIAAHAGGSVASSALLEAFSHLKPEERRAFEAWNQQHSKLRIIVAGKTGVGKSTLLNGLTGIDTFTEGHDLKPCTSHVNTRTFRRYGITVIVHDCPGLLDGSGHEEEYLQEMKEKFDEGVDIMLYCISMKVRRAAELKRHCNVIDKLTKSLGKDIWKNVVIVLTFGNSYAMGLEQAGNADHMILELFDQRLKEWEHEIHSALKKNDVDESVIENIRVQPAGYYKIRSLPGRKFWLSELWAHVLTAVSEQGQPAYVKLAETRLKHESDVTDDDFAKSPSDQAIFVGPDFERIVTSAASAGAATAGNIFLRTSKETAMGAALVGSGAVGLLLRRLLISLYEKFKARKKKVNLRKPIEDTCF